MNFKNQNIQNNLRNNFKGKYPLSENDSSVNEKVKKLFEAIKNDNKDLTVSLVKEGVDVNSRDKEDLNKTPLHVAAEKGNVILYLYLIKNGADIYAKDDLGRTAKDIAVENDHVEIITYPENLILKMYKNAQKNKKSL